MSDHTNDLRAPRARRTGRAGLLALLLGGGVAVLSAAATGQDEIDLGDTKTALELLVETRGVISKEKRDRVLAEEILQQRIDLRVREIADLEKNIAENREGIQAEEKSVSDFETREAELTAAEATMTERVVGLEARTRRLLARMPRIFRDRVELFSQRIPEEGAETKASLSERFQNVIAVLNTAHKFQQQIEITSELRTLDDGKTAEVAVMYVGFGQAWFVSNDGAVAGTGHSTEGGWEWTQNNALAPQVSAAIKIQKGEVTPDFVSLPIQVQ